jgi:energy-converting hydrogenase Eha subunit C
MIDYSCFSTSQFRGGMICLVALPEFTDVRVACVKRRTYRTVRTVLFIIRW